MKNGEILLAGDLTEAERRRFRQTFGEAVTDDPSDHVRYAVVWSPPLGLMQQLPGLQAIFSLGAGVDHVLRDPDLPDVPIVRFVDPDLTGRMVEWVTLQTLLHLRRQRDFDTAQGDGRWDQLPAPPARRVMVGIMGLGQLGRACAEALKALGFKVQGLVRTKRPGDGIKTYGPDEADTFLGTTDILVNLLPLTDETRGMIDRTLIGRMRKDGPLGGPVILNAGRGGSQVETDIAAALEDGSLRGVSLDVFEKEPLPTASPLWGFRNAVITPHVAAVTDPDALAAHVSRQIERHEGGLPLENVVDRDRGY